MRAWRWPSLISLVITLSACGANQKTPQAVPTHTAAVATHTAAVPTHAAEAPETPQLVSMRRTDGATWETLVIRTDGTGDLGIFIGERTGTTHHKFRLGQDEFARLRRLVHGAELVPQAVDVGPSAASVSYVIYAGSRMFLTDKGHVPLQLAQLTGTLSGLIDQQEWVSGA